MAIEVAQSNRTALVRERLLGVCEKLDSKPFLPLYLCAAVYLFVASAMSTRPLWYDELITYYIAKAPTVERFFSALANFDFNPPLQAALTILTFRLVGESDFAARIPSMLAFWVASICLYRFIGNRAGRFPGLVGMLVLWSTGFFPYASEARPYALMTAFLGVAITNWQGLDEGGKSALRVLGIALGAWGLVMSHVFGALALLALGFGELVRSLDRRKFDWRVWLAIASPALFLLMYGPMLRQYSQAAPVYPSEFQASLLKALSFYPEVLAPGCLALLAALAAALCLPKPAGRLEDRKSGFRKEDLALAIGLLFVPIIIDLLLMRRGGAFWIRYGIVSGLGISILFVYVLTKATGTTGIHAAVAAAVLLTAVILRSILFPTLMPAPRPMARALAIGDLDPSLPLVVASGRTFLEMNKHEDSQQLTRIFYLTDRNAATEYAHATIYQAFESVRNWLPVQAQISPYGDFIAHYPRFFVLCTLDFPEDWLVPKMMSDGAELHLLGEMRRGYRDATVFEVKLNPRAVRAANLSARDAEPRSAVH
jgi:hypothetical protein